MTTTISVAGRQRTRVDATDQQRRLARHRSAYDRRRRQQLLPHTRDELQDYAAVVRRDPCSYCMGFCGQMAADHIDSLLEGGDHDAHNLTAAGRPCNAAKREKPLLLFLLERR